jgi:predicted nucleic acid-binding protein
MANRLRDFTLSDPIFIDTNIFAYQQAAHPALGPDCRDFLHAVEIDQIQAVTSTVVLNEVIYVVQVQRAAHLLGNPNRGVIHARVAGDAALAAECWLAAERFLSLLEALEHGGLTVIDVERDHFREAGAVGRQCFLFDSDATHAVLCQQLGVNHIASNDTDVDRVPFLTRWEPRRL